MLDEKDVDLLKKIYPTGLPFAPEQTDSSIRRWAEQLCDKELEAVTGLDKSAPFERLAGELGEVYVEDPSPHHLDLLTAFVVRALQGEYGELPGDQRRDPHGEQHRDPQADLHPVFTVASFPSSQAEAAVAEIHMGVIFASTHFYTPLANFIRMGAEGTDSDSWLVDCIAALLDVPDHS